MPSTALPPSREAAQHMHNKPRACGRFVTRIATLLPAFMPVFGRRNQFSALTNATASAGPGKRRIPLFYKGIRGAGDGNRTRTISLEDSLSA